MKKRITAVMIILTMMFFEVPFFGTAADAASTDIETPAVYYTPNNDYKSGDCILTATKMMIRRASILNGKKWTNISNESLRGQATIFGLLKWTFTVDVNGMAYKVAHGTFKGKTNAARLKEISKLLSEHPEGIVVHGSYAATTGTHGVLAVRIKDGVLYAADSTHNKGSFNKGIEPWPETTMINKYKRVTSYWYIVETSKGQSIASSPNGTGISKLRVKRYTYPTELEKGEAFAIRGKVKSNKKINKVKIQIIDSEGKVILKAGKKPKKKSYNLKKLDLKIRFGTLPEGTYKYRITATDTLQKLVLVNRQFTVK